MPYLNVVIPDSLASALNNALARRATSPDSLVTAALSQYFQTGRHRAYQISTSAALVQGASEGAVSSRKLVANGDFGLGTFEHLDEEMVVLDGIIYQVRGDGTVEARRDDFQIPFAVVSRFQPDEIFEVWDTGSLDDSRGRRQNSPDQCLGTPDFRADQGSAASGSEGRAALYNLDTREGSEC
jgi:acetolactate decarboxylase